MRIKTALLILAIVGLISRVNVASPVTNGGFDIDAAEWNSTGGGAWLAGYEATGGNPGGYVTLQAGPETWSIWYQVGLESLNVLGIPPGTMVTFQCDIIDLGSQGLSNRGGMKAESWGNGSKLTPGNGVDVFFNTTAAWETYSFNYTMEPGTDSLKMILLAVTYDGSGKTARYGFDNATITVAGNTPALRPIPIVDAGLNPALGVLRWSNPDPNRPGDTLTADVFILESDVLLSKDPNLGPTILDPGVVQVAFDTTAETVNLPAAGYFLEADKYYYWAVHVTDPTLGVIAGFDWYFQTFDSPPSEVDAGPDQYVWLTMDDGTPDDGKVTFTLSGSVVDDGKSALATTWSLNADLTETAPTTSVVIDNPSALTTTVTIDNTGWFAFVLTAEDAVGSASDAVSVGVYSDACGAAIGDPGDAALAGDVDGDCKVDLIDLALVASDWLACMSEKLGCTP